MGADSTEGKRNEISRPHWNSLLGNGSRVKFPVVSSGNIVNPNVLRISFERDSGNGFVRTADCGRGLRRYERNVLRAEEVPVRINAIVPVLVLSRKVKNTILERPSFRESTGIRRRGIGSNAQFAPLQSANRKHVSRTIVSVRYVVVNVSSDYGEDFRILVTGDLLEFGRLAVPVSYEGVSVVLSG